MKNFLKGFSAVSEKEMLVVNGGYGYYPSVLDIFSSTGSPTFGNGGEGNTGDPNPKGIENYVLQD